MHCWNNLYLFQLINFVTLTFIYIYNKYCSKKFMKDSIQNYTSTYISNYRIYIYNQFTRSPRNFLSRSPTHRNLWKMMHKGGPFLLSPSSPGANMHPICFDRIRDSSACCTGCTRRIRRTASAGETWSWHLANRITQRVNSTTQTELHARLVGMGLVSVESKP